MVWLHTVCVSQSKMVGQELGSISSRYGSPVIYLPLWGKERGLTKRLEIEPSQEQAIKGA